ncbi:hypothetical protein BZZ01_11835 [Nostocales cyanobacterium HT-58-2]|nr:hypothetical protein BZZ01_11835 [Nostocales cyanobacterium HT-58-2]
MKQEKLLTYNSSQSEEKPQREKPKLKPVPGPEPCQHMKFLDCRQPIKRLICECFHCKQGILLQLHSNGEIHRLEPPCPNCSKTAIRLEATEVISVTPISSPWQNG